MATSSARNWNCKKQDINLVNKLKRFGKENKIEFIAAPKHDHISIGFVDWLIQTVNIIWH